MGKTTSLFDSMKRKTGAPTPAPAAPEPKAETKEQQPLPDVALGIRYERILHQQLKLRAVDEQIHMRELVIKLLERGLHVERAANQSRRSSEQGIDAFVTGKGGSKNATKHDRIRTTISIPQVLHDALKRMAISNGEPLRDLIERVLEEGLLDE